MIAGGVSIKVVGETLGHNRPSITIDILRARASLPKSDGRGCDRYAVAFSDQKPSFWPAPVVVLRRLRNNNRKLGLRLAVFQLVPWSSE
jgi:hypothetical protein